MLNAIICVDQRFEVKTSGLTQKFDLSNPKIKIAHAKKIGSSLRDMTSHVIFFIRSIPIHGLVVNTSCLESSAISSSPARCWTALPPQCHFVWHWPRRWTDTCALYCCTLYNFFLSNFVSGDLTWSSLLTSTSCFQCFGALGLGSQANTWPLVLSWGICSDNRNYIRAMLPQCVAIIFPWIVENTETNSGPLCVFSKPCPSEWSILIEIFELTSSQTSIPR